MSGIRRFRPGSFALLAMMLVNALVAYGVMTIAFSLFGVRHIVEMHMAGMALTRAAAHWDVMWPMIPGAAIGYALLWFWLILVGRSRGIHWTGAAIYGIIIGYADVLAGGLIVGTRHGNPLLGLLLGFVMLLLVPAIWASMATTGILLGLFNAALAQRWIEKHRPQ